MPPFPLLLLPPPASADAMRLMSASLLVLPSFASLILLMDCLKVGAVVLTALVVELVTVVEIYVAEVPPRFLHGDAVSRDTS